MDLNGIHTFQGSRQKRKIGKDEVDITFERRSVGRRKIGGTDVFLLRRIREGPKEKKKSTQKWKKRYPKKRRSAFDVAIIGTMGSMTLERHSTTS